MKNILMLCVGLMGAATPSFGLAQSYQPARVPTNYGIAAGGCYNPSAYRSPVAQNDPFGYSTTGVDCSNGQCRLTNGADCANGRCAPLGTASYSTNYSMAAYSPTGYSKGTSNCANGQCHLSGDYRSTRSGHRGANYSQAGLNNSYPTTWETRYNQTPTRGTSAQNYKASYYNPYATQRPLDANWSTPYRSLPANNPLPANNYQNSTSPFFNY